MNHLGHSTWALFEPVEKEYILCGKALEDQIEDRYFSPALLPVRCILLNHFRHRVIPKPVFPAALTTALIPWSACTHEQTAKQLVNGKFFLP